MKSPVRSKHPGGQPTTIRKPSVAPFRGLNARDPEALMQPGYATVLENLWPSGLDVQLRKGAANHVTGFVSPVRTLMDWTGVTGTSKLFATTSAGIYDATSAGAVGAAVVTLTEGWCQHTQFKNAAGSFLLVVNGVDVLHYYNGTAWATVAGYGISGGGNLISNDIINLASHQRRLWFVEKASTTAYYLGTDAITGTVFAFPLGSFFTKGGHLISINTWTVDGGNGPEDLCAFISSKGQVAIYGGTDPASATTWGLRGVFDMPEPIGTRSAVKYGGDCLLVTRSGVFPLTELLKGRPITSSLALSNVISPLIVEASQSYGANKGWQIEHLLDEKLLVLNVPTTESSAAYQFVMNTTTKGWAKFTGWNALCLTRHKNALYAGYTDKVVKIWTGVSDFGGAITGLARGHFDYFGQPGLLKNWKGVIPLLKTTGLPSISLALDVDFALSTAFGSTAFGPSGSSAYDTGLWDTATWSDSFFLNALQGVAAWPGHSAAVRLRIVCSNGTVAWSATDFLYEYGHVRG